VETSTGAEAVLAFQKQGMQDGGFLCVLMDINMPEMDGLEAAWRIRQIEDGACESCRTRLPAMPGEDSLLCAPCQCCRVPIWAVSACSDQDQAFSPVVHHLQGGFCEGPLWKQAGMDEFMTKPVNVRDLQHKLAKLQGELRRSRSGENIATDASLRLELARSGSLSRSWSDVQVCNYHSMGVCRSEESKRPSTELPCISDLESEPQDCQVK
jgi:CheY-like chemotaxis protein